MAPIPNESTKPSSMKKPLVSAQLLRNLRAQFAHELANSLEAQPISRAKQAISFDQNMAVWEQEHKCKFYWTFASSSFRQMSLFTNRFLCSSQLFLSLIGKLILFLTRMLRQFASSAVPIIHGRFKIWPVRRRREGIRAVRKSTSHRRRETSQRSICKKVWKVYRRKTARKT